MVLINWLLCSVGINQLQACLIAIGENTLEGASASTSDYLECPQIFCLYLFQNCAAFEYFLKFQLCF